MCPNLGSRHLDQHLYRHFGFCNAGFDLFGQFGAYSSLVPYVHNYYVQAVVMFMIIAGGLGFMVWVELIQYPKKRKLSLHARVVLIFRCCCG